MTSVLEMSRLVSERQASTDTVLVLLNREALPALRELIGKCNALQIHVGDGSPNTVVTESPGALYLNRLGGAGTTLWVKESGIDTNTGWVGK